jgi:predicted DNA-binding WGR domain protein
MRTPKQTLELYFTTTYLDTLHSLRNSILRRYHNIEVELQPVNPKSDLFSKELKIIADELCENPKLRLSLFSNDTDTDLLQVSYQLYISLLEQGYKCCLYAPNQKALIPSFDPSLKAIRVVHLMYKQGSSDKIYSLYLLFEPSCSSYSLLIRYGKRGGSIREVRKSFEQNSDLADKAWENTYSSKLKEGYKIGREFTFQQLSLL